MLPLDFSNEVTNLTTTTASEHFGIVFLPVILFNTMRDGKLSNHVLKKNQ
jgi:hypothetical protein